MTSIFVKSVVAKIGGKNYNFFSSVKKQTVKTISNCFLGIHFLKYSKGSTAFVSFADNSLLFANSISIG